MKTRACLAALAAALGACTTFAQLETGLDSLVGGPLQQAINALGYPNGRQDIAGDTIYVWSSSSSGVIIIPQTASMTGSVGLAPVYGTTTYNQVIPTSNSCQIHLVVDAVGIVKTWDYQGNLHGCNPYALRLVRYRDARSR